MKKLFLAFLFTLVFAGPAMAMDLHEARASGAIGEKADGYVEALKPEAARLATDVNARRRAEYTKIGAGNGQSVDVTAKIAAGEIIKNLPKGAQYQDAGGAWQVK